MLADRVYHALDITVHDFVAKRRGLSKTINESRTALDKWFKETHTTQEYVAMAFELLLCADWNGGGYHETKFYPDFQQIAKLAGVNLAKLLAQQAPAKPSTNKGQSARKGKKK